MWYLRIFLFFSLTYLTWYENFSVHPWGCQYHYFVLFNYWVVFQCIDIPHAAAAKSLQLCLTLCDPIDGSPPGSTVPGILQARTLESVAISFSNAWKWKVKVKSQSCPTLSDPMDFSPPGSSIHGIFQARVLEWIAIAFSEIYHIVFIFLSVDILVDSMSWLL